MKPRLTTSTKWTPFPPEFLQQIQTAFEESFHQYLSRGEFFFEGRIYSEEILLRVGFLEKGRLTQNNFECSICYDSIKENALKKIHNCVDAAATMIDTHLKSHFESEEGIEYPFGWNEIDFNEEKVWLQYTTVNSKLEAEADRLLGLISDDLVVEDLPEDALDFATETLLDPDLDLNSSLIPKSQPGSGSKLH